MYVFWPSGFAHLGTAGAGFSAVLPYITMFLADNAASVYVDRKIAEGMSIEKARKLATVPHRPGGRLSLWQGFCLLGPAAGLTVLMLQPNPTLG